MNKKEAIEQLESVEKQIVEIRSILEKDEFDFEKGRWYRSMLGAMVCCTVSDNILKSGYGVNYNGKWFDNDRWCLLSADIATDAEVEAMLTKEAKERGLMEFAKLKNHVRKNKGESIECDNLGSFFSMMDTSEGWNANGRIYYKGNWATVLGEVKEMTVADVEKLAGCKVKIIK